MLSPYLISGQLLQEASKQSINDSMLLDETNRLIREEKIKVGEPIPIERPDSNLERSMVIMLLRKYTYAPNKAYGYLFNTDNGISDFITYQNDFDKLVRGLTNISAEDFMKEFNYFQQVEMKKPVFKKRTRFSNQNDRKKYEEEKLKQIHKDQIDELEKKEQIGRNAIIKYQDDARSATVGPKRRNEDKNRIIKEINKKAREEFEKANAAERVGIQEEYYNNYSELITLRDKILKETDQKIIDSLFERFKSITAKTGSGLRTKKNNTTATKYPYGYWFAWR